MGDRIITIYEGEQLARGLWQVWILVEIVGEVENKLGEVQRSSSRPPSKARA